MKSEVEILDRIKVLGQKLFEAQQEFATKKISAINEHDEPWSFDTVARNANESIHRITTMQGDEIAAVKSSGFMWDSSDRSSCVRAWNTIAFQSKMASALRRIVVCVNACASIPTSRLEQVGLGGLQLISRKGKKNEYLQGL